MAQKTITAYKCWRWDKTDWYTGKIMASVGEVLMAPDWQDGQSLDYCGNGFHSHATAVGCLGFVRLGEIAEVQIPAPYQKGDKIRSKQLIVTRWLTNAEIATAAKEKWAQDYAEVISRMRLICGRNPLWATGVTDTQKERLEIFDSVWASVRDSVVASVGDSVGDSVRDSVGDSVWASVRDSVVASVGASVRDSVVASVGDSVGDSVRDSVGDSVWASVRDSVVASVGDSVWDSVGDSVRDSVWASVRDSVWDSVWASVGFCCLPWVPAWKDSYPFQAGVDLWLLGCVPSFDGITWRLHGLGGKVIHEMKGGK